ncbi:hypothetical protein AB8Q18_09590 [Neisseriaceae bacterium CLB008]|nr:hypothetical protein [Neisseriaceae bacterium]
MRPLKPLLLVSLVLGLSACSQVDDMARQQVASQLTNLCEASISANDVWQRPEVALLGGDKVKQSLVSNCGCVGTETTAAFETSELVTVLLKQGQLNPEQKTKMNEVMIRCQTGDLPPFVQKLFQGVTVIE